MVVYIGIKTENPKLLKKCLAKLFVQGLTRETLLEDDKGKTMEAMKVFSSAVGYLRDHLLTTCKGQLSGRKGWTFTTHSLYWVLIYYLRKKSRLYEDLEIGDTDANK